ncbi:hypothetical protein HK405_007627, partial [Cladochytrium tenue]
MIPNVAMYNEHEGWFKPPGVTLEPGIDLLLVIGTSFSREVEGARQAFFDLVDFTKKGCVVYLNTSDMPCDVSKKFGWFLHGRAEDAAVILMHALREDFSIHASADLVIISLDIPSSKEKIHRVTQALLTFLDEPKPETTPEPADQPRAMSSVKLHLDYSKYRCIAAEVHICKRYDVNLVSFTAFDLETLAVPLCIQPFITQRCSVKVRDGTLTASSCVVKGGQVLEVADMPNFLLGRFGQFSLYIVFPETAAKNENGTAYINFTTSDFRGCFYDRILLPSICAVLSPEDQGQFPVDFKTGVDMRTKRNRDCMPSEITVRPASARLLLLRARKLACRSPELSPQFGGFFYHAVTKSLKSTSRVNEDAGKLDLVRQATLATPELDWSKLDLASVWVDVGLMLHEPQVQGAGRTLIWNLSVARNFLRGLGFCREARKVHWFCLSGQLGGASAKRKQSDCHLLLADGLAASAAAQLYMTAKDILVGAGRTGLLSFGLHDMRTNSSVFLDCVDGMVCALELAKNQGGTHGVRIEWQLPATALSWAGVGSTMRREGRCAVLHPDGGTVPAVRGSSEARAPSGHA